MPIPDLSLIVPCYNEEESCGITIRRLMSAFEAAGHTLEIVAVDNGSTDRTGEILAQMAAKHPMLRTCRIEVNQGYGNGIITGIPLVRGRWAGMIPADGQVDAEDVVRLYESAAETRGNVVAKVRRRFRMDGVKRKLVSIAYNVLIRVLWPRLDSLDVNGSPKILPRQALLAMRLESRGWFLDPELMLKAHAMKMRVLELNVFARMRGNGISHVRASTCWEFLRSMVVFRFGGPLRAWRRDLRTTGVADGTLRTASWQSSLVAETPSTMVEAGTVERGNL
ncbi:MAG TPA: glycosyltransferase family 2 protein [Longimicrobiales bacterium]